MLYSELILSLRKQVGDLEKTVAAEWTADGTTGVLLLPLLTYPVKENSYTVKKNGILLTEVTEYTIDRETGRIDLVTVPANGDIFVFSGKRVSLTDATWMELINNTIRSLGDDYFKEVTDTASYTTTANMLSLDISAGNWIAVYDFHHRTGSSVNYMLSSNWRFQPDDGKIYFGDREEFTVTGYGIKIRGLKKYTLGTATTDTVDVQDKYITVIKYGAIAEYWRYKMREIVESLGKITQETTRTQLQELIMVIDRYERWYEREYARLKPAKPPRFIPTLVRGKPRP